MNTIRKIIGLFLLTIGAFILPRKKEEKKESESVSDFSSNLKEKPDQDKPIHFTDVHSYFEKLKEPNNRAGACISISHTLVSLAKKKNTPVRINLSTIIHFDKSGEISSTHTCYLSDYNEGKWHRLKDLNIGINSIVPLVDEVIDAMGQNGWTCMNNAREQLQSYLLECLRHNYNYMMDRCEKFDIRASMGINVFIIVDVGERTIGSNKPIPQILTKVSVKTDRDTQVESAQYIYFTHKSVEVEKPAS